MDTAQYIGLFADASDEHLRALARNLSTLETNPEDLPTVHELFRSAHTLKGMSATMGFCPIAELTHQMESALDLVRSGKLGADASLVGLLFACVDALREMIRQAVSGGTIAVDTAALRRQLAAVRGLSGEHIELVARLRGPAAAPVPHSLRVELSKLEHPLNLASELEAARVRLDEISSRHPLPELAETTRRIGRIA